MMLSRVADALFWMGRYLERADHLARAVEVTSSLELDLHGVLADPIEFEWTALLAQYQQSSPHRRDTETAISAAQRWLLTDIENTGSVIACINRARNNARSIRGSLSPPMWRELNKLYWRLKDKNLQHHATEAPHQFCEETQMGVLLFHGICDATLIHDEGWHFIQMGRYLERADKILRTLEAKVDLIAVGEASELPVSTLQWAAVLRRCAAFEAYQRLSIGRIDAERVTEFLLTHPEFPHSTRFCLTQALASLDVVSDRQRPLAHTEPSRTVGRLVSELTYLDRSELHASGLQRLLTTSLDRCSTIGRLLQQQYSLQ